MQKSKTDEQQIRLPLPHALRRRTRHGGRQHARTDADALRPDLADASKLVKLEYLMAKEQEDEEKDHIGFHAGNISPPVCPVHCERGRTLL